MKATSVPSGVILEVRRNHDPRREAKQVAAFQQIAVLLSHVDLMVRVSQQFKCDLVSARLFQHDDILPTGIVGLVFEPDGFTTHPHVPNLLRSTLFARFPPRHSRSQAATSKETDPFLQDTHLPRGTGRRQPTRWAQWSIFSRESLNPSAVALLNRFFEHCKLIFLFSIACTNDTHHEHHRNYWHRPPHPPSAFPRLQR